MFSWVRKGHFVRRGWLGMVIVAGIGWAGWLANAQADESKAIAAPPNHVIIAQNLKGWYFAPAELKTEYDKAVVQLETLKKDLDEGKIKAQDAKVSLDALRRKLEGLRKELETKQVFVAGAKVYEQTETIEFPLCPEKKLAIVANQIRVKGWAGPNVKCELKKMVLSPDGKPVDDHLKALRVVHKVERGEFAGKTEKESAEDEKVFLAKEGANFSEKDLLGRKKLVDEVQNYRSFFRDFTGKKIDLISVEGLDYQSNPIVQYRVSSEGGQGVSGGQRQRYGELTVYIPACADVCLMGARRGLVVEDLEANLVVDGEGATDQDHLASFAVTNLKGNLSARNFPLNRIADIKGQVRMFVWQDFGKGGGGLTYHDDLRDLYSPPAMELSIANVAGPVQLRLGKCKLDLAELDGPIDIENDFGDIHWENTRPLASGSHRIVTQSGALDIALSSRAWSSAKLVAATGFGSIRTNVSREEFDEFHQTIALENGQGGTTWQGFEMRAPGAPKPGFRYPLVGQEVAATWKGETADKRLTVINRAGKTVIMRK